MYDPDYLKFLEDLLTPERLARFEDVLEQRTRAVTVVLENLYHSHNASACLRSCDAFGVQDAYLIEESYRYRASAQIDLGSSRWLTLHRYRDSETRAEDCLADLKQRGYRIVATALQDDAFTPVTVPLTERTALVIGGEKDGVSDTVLERADAVVTIPMHGFVQSLNVSVACAVCLQTIVERVRQERDDWRLTEPEKRELRELWMDRSARRQHRRIVEQYWKAAAKKMGPLGFEPRTNGL
jgi:tRNA (guanosine-2'-O-)-methyltransferase